MEQTYNVKQILDRFYGVFDFNERLYKDPIEFPHRYKTQHDIEIAGFIAAALAYGKVGNFKTIIDAILAKMGNTPADFLYEFNPEKQAKTFQGIRYRFNTNDDIVALLYILHIILSKYDSVENLFKSFNATTVYDTLISFTNYILSMDMSAVYGHQYTELPSGLKQFFPSPSKGSPCKRLNMFLRWMVRKKDIDFGLWQLFLPSDLIIPLDVHIARISKCLGLTKRKTNEWRTASEITESLKEFDPSDPLKYDFALCHYGISGNCKATRDERLCSSCILYLNK
ncbi:MAG: TIGR02757 family protein [Candidatus Magnetoovum sp. WYHC-5]|nr:TIGR02757 family protein [Candidatus Magnetoovum sp. WYHC-5]